jgi:hypothetical protein
MSNLVSCKEFQNLIDEFSKIQRKLDNYVNMNFRNFLKFCFETLDVETIFTSSDSNEEFVDFSKAIYFHNADGETIEIPIDIEDVFENLDYTNVCITFQKNGYQKSQHV